MQYLCNVHFYEIHIEHHCSHVSILKTIWRLCSIGPLCLSIFVACSIVWLVRCDYCHTQRIMKQFHFSSPGFFFFSSSPISFRLHMLKRWIHLNCSSFPVTHSRIANFLSIWIFNWIPHIEFKSKNFEIAAVGWRQIRV